LIGPSGCGKSTYLRSLNRMNDGIANTRVTGNIMYKGVDVNTKEVDVFEMRKRIGMVFQRPNPFSKSIYDNIAFALRRHGERNKKKLDEAVETSLKQAALWDQVKDSLDKSALALSKEAQTVSPELNSVFEYAFYAAKRVRSETAVGSHAVSMGYAVAQLALQVFSKPEKLTVMVVAAGEMNSLVAKHLAEMGVAKIIICNRSRERADQLAQEIAHQVEVEIIEFSALAENLYRADVVSSCTGSLYQVIAYSDVKAALKKRRYQQMLMVDLAVPRDIDPKVEALDGVYLYGVDDLQSVIDENLAQRRQAAVEAEVMVNQLATQLITHQKVKEAGSTIHAYRQHSEEISQQELTHALEALHHGENAEQVLQQFAHRLTQKLMHPTSILLREAAKAENPDYFEWLQQHLQDVFEHERKPKH